jgi:hypothetical protein
LGGISSARAAKGDDSGRVDFLGEGDDDDEVGGRNILVPICNLCFSVVNVVVVGTGASAATGTSGGGALGLVAVLTNSMRPFSTMMLGGGAPWRAETTPWRIFNGIDDDLLSCDGELGAEREPPPPVRR